MSKVQNTTSTKARSILPRHLLLVYSMISFVMMVIGVISFGHMASFRDEHPRIVIPSNPLIQSGIFIVFAIQFFLLLASIAIYGPIKDEDMSATTTKHLIRFLSILFFIALLCSLLVFQQIYVTYQ